MKIRKVTPSLLASLTVAFLATNPLFAETQTGASGSPEKPPELDTSVQFEARTVYETEFFPGVRFCEPQEVDYHGDLRRVNCQDEAIIQAVSTREDDRFTAREPAIVSDRVEPNGNVLRIKFHRKVFSAQPKSTNN